MLFKNNMFSKSELHIHQQYLLQLPKISQKFSDIKILFTPNEFKKSFFKKIYYAKKRIYILALYIENDDSGNHVMSALYEAKKKLPNLDVCVLVDWHRAQRGRIGSFVNFTNSDWYKSIASKNLEIKIPVYGVPISNRESLGVLHMKGFIIDNTLIYSGASINNDYLHKNKKYRYDRYQLIKNKKLTDIMTSWINKNLKSCSTVHIINNVSKKIKIKKNIKLFRKKLKCSNYQFIGNANNNELSITPLVGLGKNSLLNHTINHLILSAEKKLILCTPYFNLPNILKKNIVYLLKKKVKVEIIIGDKTANDFYIPSNKPFNIMGTLPYLYEINLYNFLINLEFYIKIRLLKIRLWKNSFNTFHVKGIWIDNKWILITGNNFNLRGWRLDLENAILIHDPLKLLLKDLNKELLLIRKNTSDINIFSDLENIDSYPMKIKKIIKRLKSIKIDKIIKYFL